MLAEVAECTHRCHKGPRAFLRLTHFNKAVTNLRAVWKVKHFTTRSKRIRIKLHELCSPRHPCLFPATINSLVTHDMTKKRLSFCADVSTQNNIKEEATPSRSSPGMHYKRHANPCSQSGDYSICMCQSQQLSSWTRGKEWERGRKSYVLNIRSM